MLVTLMAILALETARPANCFVNGSQTPIPCHVIVNRTSVVGNVVTSFGLGDGFNVHFAATKVDERTSQVFAWALREGPLVDTTGVCITDQVAAGCQVGTTQIVAVYK